MLHNATPNDSKWAENKAMFTLMPHIVANLSKYMIIKNKSNFQFIFTKEQFEIVHDFQITNENLTAQKYIIKVALMKYGLRDDHNVWIFLPS